MISQPTNVLPSTLSGVGAGVIDATQNLTVSWDVTGDSPMTKYSITFYRNNPASSQVLQIEQTLSTPFYGHNASGEQQTFSTTIPAATLSSADIVNGYSYGYKIIITQWWGATDDESVVQTSPSVFFTRATPSLSIVLPNSIKDTATLSGSFSQADGDTVSLARWVVKCYGSQSVGTVAPTVVYDSGEIDTQLLQLQLGGLVSGYYYRAELTVQTSSGVTVSAYANFTSSYNVNPYSGTVTACASKSKPYVELNWRRMSTSVPELTQCNLISGRLEMSSDSSEAIYNGFEFGAPWSVAWRGIFNGISIPYRNVLTLWNTTDDVQFNINVGASGVQVRTAIGGTVIGDPVMSEEFSVSLGDDVTVVLTDSHYYIRHKKNITGEITTYTGETLWTSVLQSEIDEISLQHQQYCDFLYMADGEIDQFTLDVLMSNISWNPIAQSNTIFLADYNSTANATVYGDGIADYGCAIYRLKRGDSLMYHVADVANSVAALRDYGVKSNSSYKYYVFQKEEDFSYSTVIESQYVDVFFNQNFLLECVYNDTDGTYRLQKTYPFALNANVSGLSNNNSPNILQNFTRYPTRQPASSNYKSGTLTALVGTLDSRSYAYSDSWELANEITALSTSGNPKFLKDMKGEIWRIETSAAITTDVKTGTLYMPITITIPFIEVGSADAVEIIDY